MKPLPSVAHPAAFAYRPAMAEPRIKTGLFVAMALRMADRAGNPGTVLHRGDADSGGVMAVLRGRAGLVVLSQIRTAGGAASWLRATGATPVDQAAADQYIARQRQFDPDLWVVEFEAPDYQPPFEATIV